MAAVRRMVVAALGLGVALFAARRVLAAGGVVLDEPEAFFVTTRDSGIDRIDWSSIKHFRPGEFGTGVDSIDPRVILAADAMRANLGSPLMVSPAMGSTARFDGNTSSQHYAVGRRATALDLMPTMATLDDALEAARKVPAIGGIGVYPTAQPRPLIHIDVRARKPNGAVFEWMGLRDSPDEPWQYAAIDRRRFIA